MNTNRSVFTERCSFEVRELGVGGRIAVDTIRAEELVDGISSCVTKQERFLEFQSINACFRINEGLFR